MQWSKEAHPPRRAPHRRQFTGALAGAGPRLPLRGLFNSRRYSVALRTVDLADRGAEPYEPPGPDRQRSVPPSDPRRLITNHLPGNPLADALCFESALALVRAHVSEGSRSRSGVWPAAAGATMLTSCRRRRHSPQHEHPRSVRTPPRTV